jgi:aminobenzoyl-glutamate utilization protein B
MDKKNILQYIEDQKSSITHLSDQIWDYAETAYEEKKSSRAIIDYLKAEGFEVEIGIAGIETAFKASFGSGSPVIGYLGEFDALSGLSQVENLTKKEALEKDGNGHGCGHNLLGAGALAGALGLKKYLENNPTKGTVVYLGCPAEEGGSGKTFMAREGVFDDLDVALTWHPSTINGVWSGSTLANLQVYYKFYGVSAHAAANPSQGRSGLDAVELMNVGVQFLREHIMPEARIHYAITNSGGFSPNVVQAYGEVLYLIRAPIMNDVNSIYQRVNDIAKGAALMTGTQVEIDFVKACSNLTPNRVLEELLYENMKKIELPKYSKEEETFAAQIMNTNGEEEGLMKQTFGEMLSSNNSEGLAAKFQKPILNFLMPHFTMNKPLPGSTDVGDVSWICPTAQIATASWVNRTSAHSWQAVAQGKSSIAHKSLIYAGQVLAATGIDLLENPEFVEKAKEELKSRLGDGSYQCPIPKDINPRSLQIKRGVE